MVQYNKFVVTDTGTYSIDYFTFDFLLLTTIRIFDLLLFEIEKRKSSCIKYQHFQTHYFGNLKEVFQCDSLHIELSQNNFQFRLSFNPNHCINSDMFELIVPLLHFVFLVVISLMIFRFILTLLWFLLVKTKVT